MDLLHTTYYLFILPSVDFPLTTYLPLFVHVVIKFPIRQTFQTNFKKLNSTPLHSPSNSKKKSILIKLQIMYLGTQLVIPFRYKSIFRQGLWAATAFKGATSSCALIPNVSVHVSNHLGWQELLNKNQGFQVSNSFYTPSMQAHNINRLKSFLKVLFFFLSTSAFMSTVFCLFIQAYEFVSSEKSGWINPPLLMQKTLSRVKSWHSLRHPTVIDCNFLILLFMELIIL